MCEIDQNSQDHLTTSRDNMAVWFSTLVRDDFFFFYSLNKILTMRKACKKCIHHSILYFFFLMKSINLLEIENRAINNYTLSC